MLVPFAALTAVVLMTAPGVFGVDAEVAVQLHRPVLDHPSLGASLRVIGLITEPNWLRLIALLAALWLWRHGLGRTAAWLVVTMAIGGTLGIVLKQVFSRSRPEWPEAITVISGYSFPSGHAVNSMLAAGCAIVLLRPGFGATGRRWLWTAAGVFVLLVGFDRMALGVHYLTDVLAGWALALTVLFATLAAFGSVTPPGFAALPDTVAPPDTAAPPAATAPPNPAAPPNTAEPPDFDRRSPKSPGARPREPSGDGTR